MRVSKTSSPNETPVSASTDPESGRAELRTMRPSPPAAGESGVLGALRDLSAPKPGSGTGQATRDFITERPRKSLAGKLRSEFADLLRPERVIARSMPDASLADIAGSRDPRIKREALKEISKREKWASSRICRNKAVRYDWR